MRVLICPDSFTGTLSAAEAAEAICFGWARGAPHDELLLRPLSDGGPGFLAAVSAGRHSVQHHIVVRGPLGERTPAIFLTDEEGTAWIESAQAVGLHLIPNELRDPSQTTSFGLGQIIAAAHAGGAARIVVGVGGTGTSDGGAGLLSALGASSSSGPLDAGAAALSSLTSLDLAPALNLMANLDIEVATDVDSPLLGPRGAAYGFAAQKGATQDQLASIEAGLARWATLLGRMADGRSAAVTLGAGAGGGIGAALIRLGGRRVPGIQTVLESMHFADLMADVDLVVTGEGCFDWQSLRGKVVAGVAEMASERGIPTVVIAGRVELARREWMKIGVAGAVDAGQRAGEGAAEALAEGARRTSLTWSRRF